jgi:hypothetical protein
MQRRTIVLGLRLVSVLMLGAGAAAAQDLTQSDRQGPVLVTVTLSTAPTAGKPIVVKVALDTHSVELDGIAFDSAVTLRRPDGAETAPTAVDVKGAGHHREATLGFAPVHQPGPVQIVVRDVGGIAERRFTWDLR